ncbi:CTTNBP2 N-terminal-like protein [Trichinella pseudospiralis]
MDTTALEPILNDDLNEEDSAQSPSSTPISSVSELSRSDLLRLLCCLEGEVQARDVAIATLKAEKAKQLLAQAKYGKLGLREPFSALQRDSSYCDSSPGEEASESDVTQIYESQLMQLEKLISSQRKAHLRAKQVLLTVIKRHAKTVRELEHERRKRAQEVEQGDDVCMLLEKERDKLREETEMYKRELESVRSDLEKTRQALADEKERHKQMVLYLLQERRQMLVRFVEERQRMSKTAPDVDMKLLATVRAELAECRKCLEMEKTHRCRLEETVRSQEEDLNLIRQTILTKAKQQQQQQQQASTKLVRTSSTKTDYLPVQSRVSCRIGTAVSVACLPASSSTTLASLPQHHPSPALSRLRMLHEGSVSSPMEPSISFATQKNTTQRTRSNPPLPPPPPPPPPPPSLPLPLPPVHNIDPSTSGAAYKISVDHFSTVYGPTGLIMPSQIPSATRRIALPDYVSGGSKFASSLPHIARRLTNNQSNQQQQQQQQQQHTAPPPSYSTAMHYREQQQQQQQQQWACTSDDTSLSSVGGNSAGQPRQQRANGISNGDRRQNVRNRKSVLTPQSAASPVHAQQQNQQSSSTNQNANNNHHQHQHHHHVHQHGHQQHQVRTWPPEAAVVRDTDGAVEPEIAQLEAIINSFIVASSSSSSSSLSDDVKPAKHTGVTASNGSSSRHCPSSVIANGKSKDTVGTEELIEQVEAIGRPSEKATILRKLPNRTGSCIPSAAVVGGVNQQKSRRTSSVVAVESRTVKSSRPCEYQTFSTLKRPTNRKRPVRATQV